MERLSALRLKRSSQWIFLQMSAASPCQRPICLWTIWNISSMKSNLILKGHILLSPCPLFPFSLSCFFPLCLTPVDFSYAFQALSQLAVVWFNWSMCLALIILKRWTVSCISDRGLVEHFMQRLEKNSHRGWERARCSLLVWNSRGH